MPRPHPTAQWDQPASTSMSVLVGFVHEASPGVYEFTTDRNLWTHSFSDDGMGVWTLVPKAEVVNRILIQTYAGDFHVEN